MSKLYLSEKHGVNPSVLVCPFCGKDTGVALLGHMKGDVEAPRSMLDNAPCAACQDYMREGVILLSVQDGWDGKPPAPLNGGYAVVKDHVITKIVTDPELAASILKARVCHVADRAFKAMGLGEEPEKSDA